MPGDESRRRASKAGGVPKPSANSGTNPGAKPRVGVYAMSISLQLSAV